MAKLKLHHGSVHNWLFRYGKLYSQHMEKQRAAFPHPANRVSHSSIRQPVIRHFHNAYAACGIHLIFFILSYSKSKIPCLFCIKSFLDLPAQKAHKHSPSAMNGSVKNLCALAEWQVIIPVYRVRICEEAEIKLFYVFRLPIHTSHAMFPVRQGTVCLCKACTLPL